jgi:glycogen debranching enzyme
MGEGWAFTGGPPNAGAGADVTLVEGRSFCVSDRAGDLGGAATHGLIVQDTRFVEHLVLSIDGDRLEPLGVEGIGPHAATFVTRRKPREGLADSTLLVVRERYVGNGLVEDITLHNLSRQAEEHTLALTASTDFANLFEVKEGRVSASRHVTSTAADGVVHQMTRHPAPRSVRVTATGDPRAQGSQLRWRVVIPPRGRVVITVRVEPWLDGTPLVTPYPTGEPHVDSVPAVQHAHWRARSPRLRSSEPSFDALLHACTDELAGLRITDPAHEDRIILAAGAPWFMTVFGRDSLLTSWMLLPLDARVALGTLQVLAERQGTSVDPATEEQPGRILHEIRSGLSPAGAPGIDSVYYGTADATPLFVMLVGELRRWGTPLEDLEQLLPHVDRALDWVRTHGDRDGDGLVEYERATPQGLVNQGWKDSFDGVTLPSGGLPHTPIALAEVQGYVYGALRARSELAEAFGDHEHAGELAQEAHALKEAFNDRFWLPHRGHLALALDGEKQPVESLASNMGHCLWTGIVAEEHAGQVAAALVSPEMFSGFGVRTLASSMGAYNPMSYHNGSIWPHDNAVVAAGLRRYGFAREAQQVVRGILDAAEAFGGHLPELFCGFDRAEFPGPIPYPTACAPQAWAAATPLLLLRVLLGLEPDIPAGVVSVDPAVPTSMLPLKVDQLHLGSSTLELLVTAGAWRARGGPPGVTTVQAANRSVRGNA